MTNAPWRHLFDLTPSFWRRNWWETQWQWSRRPSGSGNMRKYEHHEVPHAHQRPTYRWFSLSGRKRTLSSSKNLEYTYSTATPVGVILICKIIILLSSISAEIHIFSDAGALLPEFWFDTIVLKEKLARNTMVAIPGDELRWKTEFLWSVDSQN